MGEDDDTPQNESESERIDALIALIKEMDHRITRLEERKRLALDNPDPEWY